MWSSSPWNTLPGSTSGDTTSPGTRTPSVAIAVRSSHVLPGGGPYGIAGGAT